MTRRGFTLVELAVVLAILSLAALLVIPRLPSTERSSLRSSARSLASALRYLQERSVAGKELYRLRFRPGDGTVSVTRKGTDGADLPPTDPYFSRPLLARGVTVADVLIPRLGKVAEGEVTVPFGPAGLEEFLVVHLRKGDAVMTVTAFPASGKVKILEGYREGGE